MRHWPPKRRNDFRFFPHANVTLYPSLRTSTMRRNRRDQPSLLRTAARASVISSAVTASSQATSNAMHNKAARAQPAAPPSADVEPAAAAAPTPPSDLVAQLTQLAQLKEAGALTDDEFQLAKAKLLNTSDAPA